MSDTEWRDRTFLVTATTSATADRVAHHLRYSIGGNDANWSAEEVPDGAAIVADPAGVLSLINDYVAMVLSHNEGGRIMRWKQIRAALGIKGVVR